MPHRRHLSLLVTLASLALVLAACTGANKAGKGKSGGKAADDEWVNPVQEFDEGAFKKVTLDLDGDQLADVSNYYADGEGPEANRLVRKEIDLNFDQKIDIVQTWQEGQMLQEAIDADFDGQTDWTDFYSGGERIRAEWDTAFDGHPDMIRYYQEGKLSRVEMDTNDDQAIDYWEYYEAGVMQRSGWDLNADGKIDKWGEK